MSAKTGLPDTLNVLAGKLVLLFTSAISLIADNHRDNDQIRLLMKALQLFKENKLIGVMSRDDKPGDALVSFRADLREFDRQLVTNRVFVHFGNRVHRMLVVAKITTLAQLLSATRDELMLYRVAGATALDTLESDLREFDLHLGMTPEEIQAKLPELREEALDLLAHPRPRRRW